MYLKQGSSPTQTRHFFQGEIAQDYPIDFGIVFSSPKLVMTNDPCESQKPKWFSALSGDLGVS